MIQFLRNDSAIYDSGGEFNQPSEGMTISIELEYLGSPRIGRAKNNYSLSKAECHRIFTYFSSRLSLCCIACPSTDPIRNHDNGCLVTRLIR